MGDPVDLSQLRGQKQQENGGPQPGERTPVQVSIIGSPGGPWALIDNGGNPIAQGTGDETRAAILGMVSLAALAVRTATPEAVQETVGRAQATVAAQVQQWGELNRLAELGRQAEAQAAEQKRPEE